MDQEKDKKTKKFAIRFGFAGLFVGSLFATIVLSWIFVLGVLVGSGNIPNPFDLPYVNNLFWKETPKAPPQVISPGDPVKAETIPKENPEVKLQFYENLESKRIPIPHILPVQPTKGEEEFQPPKTKEDAQSPQAKEQVKPPKAKEQPQVLKAKEQIQPPKAKEQTGSYTAQLATFQDKEKALLFLQQISKKSIKAYIDTEKSKGVELFRIRTRKFDTLDDAKIEVIKLKNGYGIGALAVKLE